LFADPEYYKASPYVNISEEFCDPKLLIRIGKNCQSEAELDSLSITNKYKIYNAFHTGINKDFELEKKKDYSSTGFEVCKIKNDILKGFAINKF
jgi:hypothetical protein